jgi:hypothetical protein
MSLIVKDTGRRWKDAVIPFTIAPKALADATLTANIIAAQGAWQAVTPVQFVPQTTEADFIRFTKVPSAPRCSSAPGRKGGMQDIQCDNSFNATSLVHEIGHAIGLQHEHQRFDRNAFVSVSDAAIADRPQDFKQLNEEALMVGPYDFNSVMHYPWNVGGSTSQPISKIPSGPPNAWPAPTAPSGGDAEGVCFMYGIVPDRTPIAALGRGGDHMELWVVAGDGTVRGAWFDGMWRHWYQLFGPTFPQRGHLAVISHKQGHMAVFGIGNDGQLYHTWFERIGGIWKRPRFRSRQGC